MTDPAFESHVEPSGKSSAVERATSLLTSLQRSITDAIVPPVCLACHAPSSSHDALCPPCWTSIHFITHPLCDRLGHPMPFDTGGTIVSAAALADPPSYHRARAATIFGGTAQKLIHGFKYADRHDARRLFGRWLQTAGRDLLDEADFLVPVPLNRWRLLHRRYNQAAILANELSRLTGVAVLNEAVIRIKATPRQVGLTSAERRANVAGAFKVTTKGSEAMTGRRIVLVDDVITTGATCNAAARTLLGAGAAHVDILALALVTDTVT
jgi:ComF family protein